MTAIQAKWEAAAFGDAGFYRDPALRIQDHFRTSCHIGGPLISKLVELIRLTDSELDHPARFDLVDVGAGDGNLLIQLVKALAEDQPEFSKRIRARGLDCRPRPVEFPNDIEWIEGFAPTDIPADLQGLMTCFELLDDVATDSTHLDNRDIVAYKICRQLRAGTALFVDYPGAPSQITGYRLGQLVPVQLDGSTNITSPVNFDSLAKTLAQLGSVRRGSQAEALRNLTCDETHPLARMQWDSDLAELIDPIGLGAHEWLTVTIEELQ